LLRYPAGMAPFCCRLYGYPYLIAEKNGSDANAVEYCALLHSAVFIQSE